MAKTRKGKRGPLFSKTLFIFGVALVFFIIAIVGFIIYSNYTTPPPHKIAKIEKPPAPPPVTVHIPTVRIPTVHIPKAKVAIVIDDMGRDIRQLRDILEIDAPISISVLPFLPHSKDIATEAGLKGREVLLHLPMEPKDSDKNDPGKGAVFTNMTEAQVAEQVKRDIDAVPFITGVNNHMGSRFTEDERLMRIVLNIAKTKNLFFLDSKTTSKSTGYRLAKVMDVKAASRQVFLDNEEDINYIKGQILELVGIAKKRGSAIAIGHPYPSTIAALKEMIPMLNKDVDIITVSALIDSIKE